MDFTHEFSERPDTFLLTGSDSSGTGVSENLEDLFPEWLGVKGYDVLGAEGMFLHNCRNMTFCLWRCHI